MSKGTGQVLRRSIGIVFSDGGLLALSATRPAGADGHGEERLRAVIHRPDGEEGQPLRGAGTLIGAAEVREGGEGSTVAFFRWSLEGREGLGHYEVVRDGG